MHPDNSDRLRLLPISAEFRRQHSTVQYRFIFQLWSFCAHASCQWYMTRLRHSPEQTNKKKKPILYFENQSISPSTGPPLIHRPSVLLYLLFFFFLVHAVSKCEIEYSCGMNACNTFIPMLCEFVCLCVCVVWKSRIKTKNIKNPKIKTIKSESTGLNYKLLRTACSIELTYATAQ